MARPRQLGVCLLIAFVALLAPPLRAAFMDEEDDATVMDTEKVTKDAATMMDTEKVTKEGGEIDQLSEASSHMLPHDDATVTETEKAMKDSTFQTPSTELAVPDASPPGALVQEHIDPFTGAMAAKFLYDAISGFVAGAVQNGPKLILKTIAMDLEIHSQMREFWQETQYICTGSSPTWLAMKGWALDAYHAWYGEQPAKPAYDYYTFQAKITKIDAHVKDRCDRAKTLVTGDRAQQLWQLAAAKCSDACGKLPAELPYPSEWTSVITSLIPGPLTEVLNSFCNDLWEEIEVILSKCEIKVEPADCTAIWALMEESLAKKAEEKARQTSMGKAATIGGYVASGAKIAGVAGGLYFSPVATISGLLSQGAVEDKVKGLMAAQANAMYKNKILLALPNKTVEMVDDYCNQTLLIPDIGNLIKVPDA